MEIFCSMVLGFLLLFCIWYAVSASIYKKTDYFRVTHKSFANMRFDLGNYGEYLIYRYLSLFKKSGAITSGTFGFLSLLYFKRYNKSC